jgi:hypothetical protein
VDELAERMTALEFGEWMALYAHDPWGDARRDVADGLVAATLANIHRKEGTRPYTAIDFAPYLKPREQVKEADPMQFINQVKSGG